MTAEDLAPANNESAFTLRSLAPAVPYVAVGVGFYALHSAWASFAIYQLGIVLMLSLEREWHRIPGLLRSRSVSLVAVAVATLSAGAALYFLAPPLGLTADLAANCASFGLTSATWIPFIVFIGLTNPWLEEVYWRGYLGSDSTGFRWHDVWFGGYHVLILAPFVAWYWSLAALILLSCVAWAWRQSVRLSDGLLVPALSHFAADVSILLAIWTLTRH